jgi:hypothetical protein
MISSTCNILLQSGASSLAWRRLRGTRLGKLPAARRLEHAYRITLLQETIREREVARVFRFLREAGVEPLLGKGWAIARLYPERGLRPYGDIDIYTHPEDYRRAQAALSGPANPGCPVDLQSGCQHLKGDRTIELLYNRAHKLPLNGVEICVLGLEDHLRLLCLHMMGHGAWRPLWMCDLALLLESLPGNFDWDYLLSGSRRKTCTVLCALQLAHEILGAQLPDRIRKLPAKLPGWLVPAVLLQWGKEEHYMVHSSPLRAHLKFRGGLVRAIRLRWPNPIQATVELGVPFNELPRWPFQATDCVRRAILFGFQLLTHRA